LNINLKKKINIKNREREKIPSRCYIVFNSKESMEDFMIGYSKIFCDEKG
jgi:hypothetical protein